MRPDASGVAVIGVGAVYPGASSAHAFWDNIVAGVDAITDAPTTRWDDVFYDPDARRSDRFYCRRGGFVDDLATVDPTAFGIMPVAAEGAEPDQLLALHAAAAALADAGAPHERARRERIGVILGRGGYVTPGIGRLEQRVGTATQLVEALRVLVPGLDDEQLDQVRHEFQAQLGPDRPEASIGLVPNLAASRIANRLDFQGPAYTIDAACASSLLAVDHATRELQSGRCDLVVAGGVHHSHGLTIWSVFSQLGALSRTQAIRPFSREADGILIGEGTGIFVLKRTADAERDGDRIYAVIRGVGVASDGRDASLMSPRVEGQVLALERAWGEAGLDPTTVGLIEAHGTATPAGDQAELDSLRQFFGKADRGAPTGGLGSVKSMIGHAMPAAGAAGLLKAVLAVHHGVLPPTLHADDPNPLVAETRFRLIAEAAPWTNDVRRAGVNAFGFGGINSHVVIEQHRAPGRVRSLRAPTSAATVARVDPAGAPATEAVLLLAAPDLADLRRQLAQGAPFPDRTVAPPDGPVRLAIVAPDAKRLALAAKILERGQPWRGRNDIWFTDRGLLHDTTTTATTTTPTTTTTITTTTITEPGDPVPRVAFVFPGVEPSFDPHVDDVAAHLGLDLAPIPDDAPALERQGRGIIAVGRLLDEALGTMGIRPDLVAGHSLGEWSGEIATELIPREHIDAFIDNLRPGHLEVPDVVFAALGCGADVALEVIADLDDVSLSHDNCPHQSVICGSSRGIGTALERLTARRVLAQELPFRSGFHSPMFAPYLPQIREHLQRLPLQPPTVPLWSATTCASYPRDPDEIRALELAHLVQPVRFRQLIEALYDEGVRAFVQVGLGSLVGFIDDTLKGRDYVAIAAHTTKRTGLGQLARVGAALWVEGRDVHFTSLHPPDAAVTRDDRGPTSPIDAQLPAPVPTGREIRLDLGSRLVRSFTPLRLPPDGTAAAAAATDAAAQAPSGPVPVDDPHAPPVAAAFAALLSDATSAGREVLDLWRTGPTTGPIARPVAAPAAVLSAGEVRSPGDHPAPDAAPVVTPLEFSLAVEPAWADHAFYRQAPGWTDESDRFPLVPMTAMIALFRDHAARHDPGRIPIALEDVRATKWLAVEPPGTVALKVTPVPGDPDRIRTALEGHSRATVVLAADFPAPPTVLLDPPGTTGPAPISGSQLYDDRWMFHGPAYQGVRAFTGFGPGGIRGRVQALPAPGALLDTAGQLLGYWVAASTTVDQLVLPTSIDRIDFFGPDPEPGETLTVTVAITNLAPRAVRCDIDLVHDGRLWARATGWEERRFDTDADVFTMLRRPEDHGVSQLRIETLGLDDPGGTDGRATTPPTRPTPAVSAVTRERWPDAASRDVLMRRYLGRAERADYDGHNPRAQRQWLLGRIAAKDAVRRLLDGPVFPAEIEIMNDETGRPHVGGHGGRALAQDIRISIAHTGWIGVAHAAVGRDVGIDIEAIEPRSERFEQVSLTVTEQALDRAATGLGDSRDAWLTRLWAAKEAAAKATGRGLGGRPKDFEVRAVDGARLLIGDRWIRTQRRTDLHPDKEHIIAWTS